MNFQESVIEGVKELVRVSILAAIPILIMGLESGSIDWKTVGVAMIIASLRAIDRIIHKWEGTKLNGISPI